MNDDFQKQWSFIPSAYSIFEEKIPIELFKAKPSNSDILYNVSTCCKMSNGLLVVYSTTRFKWLENTASMTLW